jgi:hypothetical protein
MAGRRTKSFKKSHGKHVAGCWLRQSLLTHSFRSMIASFGFALQSLPQLGQLQAQVNTQANITSTVMPPVRTTSEQL